MSSSNKRLMQILDSAYINNDKQLAIDTYNDWQVSHCYYPVKQRIYDAHTMQERIITIACGKCYHCLESKINEWCTRMYAHAEDFKNVYFITLTYRSISNPNIEVNKLLLNKLKQSVWHLDALNATNHLSWNPCLLVKDHYQRFMKRLRKNTGLNDITYVLSGEYGTDYGRPHFHMVLFTNGTLTKRDIVRAWSVCLWKTTAGKWEYRRNQRHDGVAYDFPIGRVDFNDLVSNGTFNTTAKIRVDGKYLNAGRCFAYVCKYVCKRDTANLDRVRLAYRNLFVKKSFVKIFDNEVQFNIVKSYLQKIGYKYDQIPTIYKSLKQLSYEKTLFEPSQSVLLPELLFRKLLFGKEVYLEFYPQDMSEFLSFFSPFCEFSRGCPIGSIYAKRNISEFAEGVFTKPLLQDSAFIVPSYFRTKARNYLYRLRTTNKTLKGISYNLGAMPNLYGRFLQSLQTGVPPREHLLTSDGIQDYQELVRNPLRTFCDAYTHEKIVLLDETAQYFKYSRKHREYVRTKTIPLADWIRTCCDSMQAEFKRHSALVAQAKDAERLREKSELLLTDFCGDFGLLRDTFVSKAEEQRKHLQREYHAVHLSVE